MNLFGSQYQLPGNICRCCRILFVGVLLLSASSCSDPKLLKMKFDLMCYDFANDEYAALLTDFVENYSIVAEGWYVEGSQEDSLHYDGLIVRFLEKSRTRDWIGTKTVLYEGNTSMPCSDCQISFDQDVTFPINGIWYSLGNAAQFSNWEQSYYSSSRKQNYSASDAEIVFTEPGGFFSKVRYSLDCFEGFDINFSECLEDDVPAGRLYCGIDRLEQLLYGSNVT